MNSIKKAKSLNVSEIWDNAQKADFQHISGASDLICDFGSLSRWIMLCVALKMGVSLVLFQLAMIL